MNEDAKLFRPEDIIVKLGDKEYRLLYDLNAFCEMEKLYDSTDSVLQMLLGAKPLPDLTKITYLGNHARAVDIKIGDKNLEVYLRELHSVKESKSKDTLNLLWLGCLHDHTVFTPDGEVEKYTIGKGELAKYVTFKNVREVNAKIITSILRDLVVPDEVKNAEAPEVQDQQPQKSE